MQNSEQGLANSLRGIGTGVQPSWWHRLNTLEVPTVLIVGELDLKFVTIAEEMHRLLPNSELVVIRNAGHTVHLEQPKDFSNTMIQKLHRKKG
jgi:2-succinyl-6-hydroxy-2,4-cyclohexadiene-1-carboxylate synthase